MSHANIDRRIKALDLEAVGGWDHAFTSVSTQAPYKLCYLTGGPDHSCVMQTATGFLCLGKK